MQRLFHLLPAADRRRARSLIRLCAACKSVRMVSGFCSTRSISAAYCAAVLFCQLLKFSFRQRGICFFEMNCAAREGTDLTRVECGAARPRHTMRSGALTSGKQSAHRRLPPEIDRDSTVAMLCAKRDLQIDLPRQIHASLSRYSFTAGSFICMSRSIGVPKVALALRR